MKAIAQGQRKAENPVDRAARDFLAYSCQHWLAAVNVLLVLFALLPWAAPVLAAYGFTAASKSIFVAYSLTCHQMPSRSYFIFGHQVAFCERNVAIYLAMALSGIVYSRYRDGLRPMSWKLYFLLILPMAIDGFTQLFGWRESNWYLRTVTGALFGWATIWLTFPYLQESFDELEAAL